MVKIVVIAVICAILLIYLKSVNSEYFSVALLGAGVVIVSCGLEYVVGALGFMDKLIDVSGFDPNFYSIIVKVLGIAYIVQFACGIIEDLGLKSLSDKLVFIGKLAVLSAFMPIILQVFDLFYGMIK